MRIISIANVTYCACTAVVLCIYFYRLTIVGLTYFLGEIFLVCFLAFIEWKVADKWVPRG